MEIYTTNLKYVISFLALILVAFSLYQIFTKGIDLGVDFKGGSLIVLDSPQEVSKEEFQNFLRERGFNSEVKVFTTPNGYRYEITTPHPEFIDSFENIKRNIDSYFEEYSQAVLSQDVEKQEELSKLINQELEKAVGVASSLGIDYEVTSTSPNEARTAFYELYGMVYDYYEKELVNTIEEVIKAESFSFQLVSPLLSVSFTQEAQRISLISAFLVSLFVFIYFRELIPSLAVLIGALSDLIIALGGMAFFDIPLSLATFAALLMIIGYSLDTDTLLTIRMIKRKEEAPAKRAEQAFRTGSTMSVTAIIAFSVIFLLSSYFRISLYYEIASVALIGLLGDLVATWGINAMLLLFYLERKGHESKGGKK